MIVAQFTSVDPEMGKTRTYERFFKMIGARPHLLGVVSRMYEDLTLSYLTDSLRNVIYRDEKVKDKYTAIDAMSYEWEIETNFVKEIEFAAVPEGDGANGSEITMAFTERYFEKDDLFRIKATGQQCFVVDSPVRKADNYWEVQVRLVDNDYSSVLDFSGCDKGMTCKFISNYKPELHEDGHVKYQSNIEKHRGYISTHRVEDSYSAQYRALEDKFIAFSNDRDDSKPKAIFKMDSVEKNLLDDFNQVRNLGGLLAKGNVDPRTGKATISDKRTGRQIIISDGVIPQVERFAGKYMYNQLNANVLQTILMSMNKKAKAPTGNHYLFVVNEALWNSAQTTLLKFLVDFKVDGTMLFSQEVGKNVKVGNTFGSYEFGGNTITFKVDRALSHEYGEKGFGVCIDMTQDKSSNQAPIAAFTLKGKDMIMNTITGVGGEDGLSSGEVSSRVAGAYKTIWGYSGFAVFNPYRSFILMES